MALITGDDVKSLLPEKLLIRNGDADALGVKYFFEMHPEARIWAGNIVRTIRDRPVDSEHHRYFGSISINWAKELPFDAQNVTTDDVRLDTTHPIHIHLVRKPDGGRDALVRDLGKTADYIRVHRELLETRYIAGLTYNRLARVAAALGFQTADADKPDPLSRDAVLAIFQAINAISGRHPAFGLEVVYMPTSEFVDRFGSSGAWPIFLSKSRKVETVAPDAAASE